MSTQLFCTAQIDCKSVLNASYTSEGFSTLSSDFIYEAYGWVVNSSWGVPSWDGMVWCPDHLCAAEDWFDKYEDN